MQIDEAIYQQNLNRLQRRFPPLAKRIDETPINESFQITFSKSASPILTYNGTHLLSSYSPQKQVDNLVLTQIKKSYPLQRPQLDTLSFLSIGLGFGYLPLSIIHYLKMNLNETSFPTLFVVENDFCLFKLALMAQDLTEFIDYPNLIILPQVQAHTVIEQLSIHGTPEFLSFSISSFTHLDLPYYQNLEDELFHYRQYWQTNFNTHRQFGRLWSSNLFHSIHRLQENPIPTFPISKLFGQFHNQKALIVAAGPSLNQYIDEIKDFEGKGILIAVDTATSFLQINHIHPNFIVISDCQYWNSRHLDQIDLSSQSIITELTVHPSLFSKPIKEIFLYSSRIPIYRAIETLIEPFGEVGTGGSVATTAWDIARLMGASEICCVGLDLSYTQSQTHCFPSRFEQNIHKNSYRLSPLDNYNANILFQASQEPKTRVKTDPRMSLYANWFSQQISRFPGNYYRLGPIGYPIIGMKNLSAAEFKKRYLSSIKSFTYKGSNGPTIDFPKDLLVNTSNALETAIERLCTPSEELNSIIHNDYFAAALLIHTYSDFIFCPRQERKTLLQKGLKELLPRDF